MLKYLAILTISAFLLGFAVHGLIGEVSDAYPSLASGDLTDIASATSSATSLSSLTNPRDVASPFSRISRDDIHVFKDQVVIDIKNPQWATFTDTNSMDPVFDAGHFALEVVPSSPEEVHVGDIISYQYPGVTQGNLIHRVIQVGTDEEGWYAIVKGDNNARADPGKVRFSQVRRVVAAIVY